MTADNRTVHTDALATLGTIIGEGECRDAIHLGVEPVEAGMALAPGAHVAIRDGKAYAPTALPNDKGVGIVDPFLTNIVRQGERFWLIVYPRQITSLRHVWEHPDFPASGETYEQVRGDRANSKAWIEDYAAGLDLTYRELMDGAEEWVTDTGRWGSYLVKGGTLEGETTDPAFWDHFSAVTGIPVTHDKRENFFSCSC